jgi:tetratricopeptide (TPR) repeat protein
MSNKHSFTGAVSLVAGAVVAAALIAGCGTDEQISQKTEVTKNTRVVSQPAVPAAPQPVVETPAVAQTPEPPRDVTYQEAEAAYLARNYDQAADLFARYVERRSENPWGHYMQGLSAWKSGQLHDAEVAFKRALELDSTHEKSYVNLTRVLLEAGRPGEASTTLDHALELNPRSGVAWRLKGRVSHDLGNTDDAIVAYQRAIELDPQDAWSMNNLAYIYLQQERFEDALPPLARAVELRTDVAVFFNNLGMALERTGHLQSAEQAYAAAIAADPSNQRAADNGERIAAVVKEPDLDPVDLAQLTAAFAGGFQPEDDSTVATATPLMPPDAEVTADSTVAE